MDPRSMSDVPGMQTRGMLRAVPSSKNLPLMNEQSASSEVLAQFTRYRERFGRADIPGIVLCFATNLGLLTGMMEIAETLLFGESLLSRKHKEMIATFVSHRNTCPYCADSHAALLGAQGCSAEVICSLRVGDFNVKALTTAEVALLRFAGKVNANSPPITRADVDATMQAGWTEEQVAESVHIAALFSAFNRIANGFGLHSPYSQDTGEEP